MAKLRVTIVGQDTLAAAIRTCCEPYVTLTNQRETTDVLWICYDTPIDQTGQPDSEWVMDEIYEAVTDAPPIGVVLVSSQMPVGTIRKLEHVYPMHAFAYAPENIRVATGVADFQHQARVVVGRRTLAH